MSCALPWSRELTTYARVAEELGFERVWIYDSPALYGDVWMALVRVAESTERIGLGTGVAIPSLRHVMVTASCIAAIEDLAPGRLLVAFGTGFTGRRAMGQVPMKWADLDQYVRDLRGLLRGDVVEIDGAACQMIQSAGFGPDRPISVPLLVAPMGPKGFVVAGDIADGVILAQLPNEDLDPRWKHRALLVQGTVLDPDEDHNSPRVRSSLGPVFLTQYHAVWQWSPTGVDSMPGGAEWRARIEAERPEQERHLVVHEGHLVAVTDRDRPNLDVAGPTLLETGWTGSAAEFQDRLDAAGAAGITEVVLTVAGPHIARELERFAAAAR